MSRKKEIEKKETAMESKALSLYSEKKNIFEERKEESSTFPDFKKFENDFNLIRQKISAIFSEYDPKADAEGLPVLRYLVYQLIWTFKYLLEMAVLENNSEWLKSYLTPFKQNFDYIKERIIEVNPQYIEEIERHLTEIEALLKRQNKDLAFRWAEDILSIGGSIVRERSKVLRATEAKETLKIISIGIASHNEAALHHADNYQQYLREKTFNRDIEPHIEANNRLWQLAYIEKKLEKNPENESLLSSKQQRLQEQKEYEAKEAKLKDRMGEQRYHELIIKRKNRVEKYQAQTDLNILIHDYVKAMENLNSEESEIHIHVALKLDSLQKSLSKTFAGDHIILDFPYFTELLQHPLKAVKKLENLSVLKFEEPAGDDAKFLPGPVASAQICLPSEMVSKLLLADCKNVTSVKAIRETYLLVLHTLAQSGPSAENDELREDIQKNYEKFLQKVAQFILQLPKEKQPLLLFNIDPQKKFYAKEVSKKYKELSLIFHTDKIIFSKEIQQDIQNLFIRIVAIKEELLQQLKWQQIRDPFTRILEQLSYHVVNMQTWLEELVIKPSPQAESLAKNKNRLLSSPRQLKEDSVRSYSNKV